MVQIPLGGKSAGQFALVDDEDAALAQKYRWHINNQGYVKTTIREGKTYTTLYLHRLICPPPDGMITDHRNNVKTDCTRGNLRVATRAQNIANRGAQKNNKTGWRGVSYSRDHGGFRACIRIAGQQFTLGTFPEADEAAYVVDQAALQLHGEYAWTNLL
jgi:hypothetical protein